MSKNDKIDKVSKNDKMTKNDIKDKIKNLKKKN